MKKIHELQEVLGRMEKFLIYHKYYLRDMQKARTVRLADVLGIKHLAQLIEIAQAIFALVSFQLF